MVKKLQLYVQQVNCSLEDTSQQVLASLPRVSHETEVLCHEARSLQKKLQEVEGEISKVSFHFQNHSLSTISSKNTSIKEFLLRLF